MKLIMHTGQNDQDSVICDLCKHILIRRYTSKRSPGGFLEEILEQEKYSLKTSARTRK